MYIEFNNEGIRFLNKPFDENTISLEHREQINSLVDYYLDKSSTYLMELTHNQTPWKEAYKKGKGTLILNESLKDYFSS